MILGQNFRYGFFDVPPQERLREIQRAGFDSVMFWWGEEYEATDGSRYDLIEGAKKLGLKINTVHFPSTHADYLWREEFATEYVNGMLAAIRDCGRYGVENLVMHTTRKLITPPYNENGLNELSRAVKLAEEEGVNIAVENTRFPEYNRYIFDNLPSPRLTLCYDTGHENAYTKNWNILESFGHKLSTTHLHDNHGSVDEHLLMGRGSISFLPIFLKLKELKLQYFNLESALGEYDADCGKLTPSEYLQASYRTLVSMLEAADIQ